MIIKTVNLVKEYKISKEKSLRVLDDINVEINEGEVVSIVGPSGAGKSTLLHLMGTLDKPTSGEVLIDGQNVFNLKSNELAHFRNTQIGFIFQFHHLLPEFTSLENVCLAAMISGKSYKEVENKAKELMELGGQIGNDRVMAGVHWPSDVEAGRKVAAAFVAAWLA